MKLEVGQVYSGYYGRTYVAFEVTGENGDYYKLDITASSDENKMYLGERAFYKKFEFVNKGNYTKVAMDYSRAKIDLLLDLKQTEWLKEELEA